MMGLAGAAIIAFVIWKPLPVEGYPSYWALAALHRRGALRVGRRRRPDRRSPASCRSVSSCGLGLVSYGWYLWHWPLLVLGESVNLAPPPCGPGSGWS